MLENRGITWNVLQVAATSTTKKVITKCVHHNMLLKTLHCAHIPFTVVPEGAQPLAQSKPLGEAEAIWRRRRGGLGAGGGAVKGESSLPVKDQPSV